MLQEFETWFSVNASRLNNINCIATLNPQTTNVDNKSIYASIDTKKYMGRITLWESGACDREAINLITEDRAFYKHTLVHTLEELYKVLETFIEELECN